MLKKYMKLFSLAILGCLFQNSIQAQPYSIHLDLPSYKNDTILLTHYFNGKIYVNDTLKISDAGTATISGEEALPQGIYQLYFNEQKQFDFLLGEDQKFSLRENNNEFQISGSKESKKFQEYVEFMASKKKEANKIRQDSIYETALKRLDEEVQAYLQNEAQKYAGTFYGKFVASNLRVEPDESQIPEVVQKNDSLLWIYKHNYLKQHYWDHFDLNDPRMWRTPTIHARLENFFNKVLIQLPDSVLPEAIRLIEASRKQPDIFENLVSFALNNSVKSEYMSMENVFVALAEKYYLSGDAFWASPKTLKKIREEVRFRKNNLVGLSAKELFLEDQDGNYHNLYELSTPFTLLVFWDPDCGHCKKQIPQIFDDIYLKTDPSKLSVMAVYTQTDKKDWLNFIDEHGLDGWINVWDPHQISNFRVNYDVRTTPMIYLLDKDKKIIAKKLSVETTKKLLDQLIKDQN